MREVLVLNSTYEPIQVLNIRKAIKLLISRKACLEKKRDTDISSVNFSISYPSVIKLNKYIKYKRRPVIYSRKNILIRDNYTCQYCGNSSKKDTKVKMTIDHIVPISKGGTNNWLNAVACCIKCNLNKSNKSLKEFEKEFGLNLIKQPHEPSIYMYLRCFKEIEEWKEYLYI
jgi:5-methylcytosine-specific restriction endonuclease McrA